MPRIIESKNKLNALNATIREAFFKIAKEYCINETAKETTLELLNASEFYGIAKSMNQSLDLPKSANEAYGRSLRHLADSQTRNMTKEQQTDLNEFLSLE